MRIFILIASFFFGSCMAEKAVLRQSTVRTFLQVEKTPPETFQKTLGFIEWIKGWEAQVRDPQKGLLVTEWIRDLPQFRYRWTFRVSEDPKGSLVTTYVTQERLNASNGLWEEIPSDGTQESRLLTEFELSLKQR